MFDAGSLWVAAKYQIPMLVVMFNNRAYYNDWNHQLVLARTRGTDPDRAHIGMDLFGPDPDFAGLARSMGWYAEGPFENGDNLQPAIKRAIAQVKQGQAGADRRCLRPPQPRLEIHPRRRANGRRETRRVEESETTRSVGTRQISRTSQSSSSCAVLKSLRNPRLCGYSPLLTGSVSRAGTRRKFRSLRGNRRRPLRQSPPGRLVMATGLP